MGRALPDVQVNLRHALPIVHWPPRWFLYLLLCAARRRARAAAHQQRRCEQERDRFNTGAQAYALRVADETARANELQSRVCGTARYRFCCSGHWWVGSAPIANCPTCRQRVRGRFILLGEAA